MRVSGFSWKKADLGPFDQVKIGIDGDGMVEVVSGSASVGQGMETAIAQICADTLGVDYRRIRVTHGQTDRIEYGMGAFASRVTVMTGEATRIAACAVKAKAIEVASELLQAPAAVLDVVDGEVVRTDTAAGPSIGLDAIARALVARLEFAPRAPAGTFGGRLVPYQSHELPLRRAHRGNARRPRHRRRRHRALSCRLRCRQSGQSDAD